MEFINDKSTFVINKDCSEIVYLNTKIPVTNIYVFNNNEASFVTKDYRIKFSKGILNIYNLKDRTLLDTFTFTKNIIIPENTEGVLNSFILKKDYIISFLKKNNDYFINNNNIIEKVIKVTEIGLDTMYLTEFNNVLIISTKSNNRFNGIPVGKI